MATKQLNSRIQWKRDTSANWESNNPVLLDGEIIIVITNAGETRFKVGDGVKTYTQLPFQDEAVRALITDLSEEVDTKLTTPSGNTGQVIGYVSNNVVGAIDLPNSGIKNISATLTASSWNTEGSYVYQQINCDEMTEDSVPFITPQYTVLTDEQNQDWSKIVYVQSFSGYCRIYASSAFNNNINIVISY